MAGKFGDGIGRRQLLLTGSAGVITVATGIARPAISRAGERPVLSHGVQSGDADLSSGTVWTRADRPSRITFEIATTDSFKTIHRTVGLDALPETDFAVKALIRDLPAGQDIFFRAKANELTTGVESDPLVGRFRTAPAGKRDISFVWSGDTAGQGWGIDESRGGMRIYDTMLKLRPDFFIHSGDTIYADGPVPSEQKLPDGSMWKNIVTEEVSKVAETLAEYRGRYKYNLMDRNLRAFNAEVPMMAQWDDHEVTNNWSSSKQLADDKRYSVKSIGLLAARGMRAFHEYMPMSASPEELGRVYRKVSYGPSLDIFFLDMRTYRAANGDNRQSEEGPETAFLGEEQLTWLKRELVNSRATWKVIAADMPLGLVVFDNGALKKGSEAMAQGDGPALGRELEIAALLRFIKHARIRNTVWLTADVHYTAAHYYDPNKAQFQDFDPFWEFVSGPLHAGSFGPNGLDNTFGPQLRYIKAPSAEQGPNTPPAAGLQFFGHVAIDGQSEAMKVTLKDVAGADLWSTVLEPARG
jgi:alkaline phosphatase D